MLKYKRNCGKSNYTHRMIYVIFITGDSKLPSRNLGYSFLGKHTFKYTSLKQRKI